MTFGNIQLNIEGYLKLPEIALVSQVPVEFPDTFIGESSTMEVKITNSGASGTAWIVKASNSSGGKDTADVC